MTASWATSPIMRFIQTYRLAYASSSPWLLACGDNKVSEDAVKGLPACPLPTEID